MAGWRGPEGRPGRGPGVPKLQRQDTPRPAPLPVSRVPSEGEAEGALRAGEGSPSRGGRAGAARGSQGAPGPRRPAEGEPRSRCPPSREAGGSGGAWRGAAAGSRFARGGIHCWGVVTGGAARRCVTSSAPGAAAPAERGGAGRGGQPGAGEGPAPRSLGKGRTAAPRTRGLVAKRRWLLRLRYLGRQIAPTPRRTGTRTGSQAPVPSRRFPRNQFSAGGRWRSRESPGRGGSFHPTLEGGRDAPQPRGEGQGDLSSGLGEGRAGPFSPSKDAASVAQGLCWIPSQPPPPQGNPRMRQQAGKVWLKHEQVLQGGRRRSTWADGPPLQPSGSLQEPHSLAAFGRQRFWLVLLPEQQLPGEWEVL